MAITLRAVKQSPLTYDEVDINFATIPSASISGSSIVFTTTGSASIGKLPSTTVINVGLGQNTAAPGQNSHAEGYYTTSSGQYSHAEGQYTVASGEGSHAEGVFTIASGSYSHAEGSTSRSPGYASHAEGESTISSGMVSHAEGISTVSSGDYSHAEGGYTLASGEGSHAEGMFTVVSGEYSHAEGFNTVALGPYQHVQGQYNIFSSAQSAFIVGNGTSDESRSNLVFASGSQVQITGSLMIKDIMVLAPRTTTPTGIEGMVMVSGSGVDTHIYCYLNSTWKQLDN